MTMLTTKEVYTCIHQEIKSFSLSQGSLHDGQFAISSSFPYSQVYVILVECVHCNYHSVDFSSSGIAVVSCRCKDVSGFRVRQTTETAFNATIFFYPTLEHYKTMYAQSVVAGLRYSAPFNTFYNAKSLATPISRTVVSPNVDTLYSAAWLDLRAEPLLLSVPSVTDQDGVTPRYYSMQMVDAYTYNFAIVGSRTTGNAPQMFAIAGPNWKGDTPPGVQLFQSKTEYVFLLGRTRVYNDSDAEWVTQHIQPFYTLTGLNSGKISPQPTNLPPFPPLNMNDTDPTDGRTLNLFEVPECFAFINFMLGYMDMYDGDKLKFKIFSEIGIGPNVSFTPILGNKKLYNTILLGVRSAYQVIIKSSLSSSTTNGWSIAVNPPPFGNYSAMDGRDLVRAVSAYVGLFGQDPAEAYYPLAKVDVDGNPLDCSNNVQYTLKFPANEPQGNITLPGFWSVTMYGSDGFLVSNDINRYKIGNTTTDLYYDPTDGSLTVYIQHAEPESEIERRNWLPAPDGVFYLIARLYIPTTLSPPYIPPGIIKQ